MKNREALDIVIQSTAQIQATRQVHQTIAEAVNTLEAALERAGLLDEPAAPKREPAAKPKLVEKTSPAS